MRRHSKSTSRHSRNRVSTASCNQGPESSSTTASLLGHPHELAGGLRAELNAAAMADHRMQDREQQGFTEAIVLARNGVEEVEASATRTLATYVVLNQMSAPSQTSRMPW